MEIDPRPVRVIGIDLMDTLILDPYREVLPRVTGLSWEQLERQKDPAAWPEFELDAIDEANYLRRSFGDTDRELLRQEMFRGFAFLPGMETLLADLSSRFPVHLMSNYNRPWFEQIREQFGLDRFIAAHHVSFMVGERKPARRYFERVVQRIDCSAEELLFIDDRAVNVEAARAAGLQALLFQNAVELRRALQLESP